RPSLARLFHVPAQPGLRQALEGPEERLTGCIQRTAVERLWIMPSGVRFWSRWGRRHLFSRGFSDKLLSRFRNIIVELPSPRTGALHAFPYSALDSIVLIVGAGYSGVRDVQESVRLLAEAGAKLSGAVLSETLPFGVHRRNQLQRPD